MRNYIDIPREGAIPNEKWVYSSKNILFAPLNDFSKLYLPLTHIMEKFVHTKCFINSNSGLSAFHFALYAPRYRGYLIICDEMAEGCRSGWRTARALPDQPIFEFLLNYLTFKTENNIFTLPTANKMSLNFSIYFLKYNKLLTASAQFV